MKILAILLVSVVCLTSAQFGGFLPKVPGGNLLSNAGSSIPGLSSIPKIPVISDLLKKDFGSFKNTFNKVYKSAEEETQRLNIFASNKDKIAGLNDLFDKGLSGFKVAANLFSDLTLEEFSKTFNGFGKNLHSPTKQGKPAEKLPVAQPMGLPTHVDWREKGAVTPVKFQDQCASCWAFAAAGALEAQNFKKTKNLKEVSIQNLMDCSSPFGSSGCQGGLMEHAYKYVTANKGVLGSNAYPYEGKNGQCRYQKGDIAATSEGFIDLPENDEKAMEYAVANIGPVAVAIHANLPSFQLYKEGIYNDPECANLPVSHAMLVVGYGEENGDKYWILKNSYSDRWGEKGYMRIARGKNMCGIAVQASVPKAAQ